MINRYLYNQTKRNFSVATLWVEGGSNMDNFEKKGINQILCSLLTRGCEGFENYALSDFVESCGAELRHEVFEDGMTISIKSLNIHFYKLLPLLDLIINKPILSRLQFQRVKSSTLNTIKKDKENPFNTCFEKWRKIVYEKHPYAYNSIGYEKDVSNITYQDILSEYERFKLRRKYLISNNISFPSNPNKVLTNKISKEKINFKKFQLNNKNRIVCSHNNSNQTIIMLGNQTCSRCSYEYFHLKVLESYLSFGMSSILFKLFREKNGITYDVGVINPDKRDNAPFLVYLSVSNQNSLLAFELLRKLWGELLFSLIPDKEIHLAKEKLKSFLLINNQSLDEVLQRKIQLLSYGISPYSDKDNLSSIDAITSEDIKKVANKYFNKPFLSINGEKKICSKLRHKWVEFL